MKLDADDQEEAEKIQEAAKLEQTPKWEQSPSEIASSIANDFYCVTQIGHWWARLNDRIHLLIDGDERE